MTRIGRWLFALLVAAGAAGCQNSWLDDVRIPLGSQPSSQVAMKGMELYSWPGAGGEWNYSLVLGTNRQKTLAEVQDPAGVLVGEAALKARLAALPAGEQVLWLADLPDDANNVLALPPAAVQDDLVAYCQARQVALAVVGPN